MIKSVTIIGLGSLGSFFADNISKLPGLELLVLVDYDSVEPKNLKNSIYQLEHINEKKIDALEKIIRTSTSANILKVDRKYDEKTIKLPKCDLVFDCRDFICDRGQIIDVRMYISFRNLIIDCKKNVKKEEKRGRYVEHVTKPDVMNAAFQAFLLVSNGMIFDFIRNEVVHQVELDISIDKASETIMDTITQPDLVYDFIPGEDKVLNLHQEITSITEARKTQEIPVYIGTKKFNHSVQVLPQLKNLDFEKSNYNVIPSTIRNITEIVNNIPLPYSNYIIRFVMDGNKSYIELLPETGGA